MGWSTVKSPLLPERAFRTFLQLYPVGCLPDVMTHQQLQPPNSACMPEHTPWSGRGGCYRLPWCPAIRG